MDQPSTFSREITTDNIVTIQSGQSISYLSNG